MQVPPSAIESEKAIIGCCLNTPKESLPEAQLVLTQESFYSIANQTLWEMFNQIQPDALNTVSIYQKLKERNMSEQITIAYLAECQDAAFSSANIQTWIAEVLEKQTLRSLINVGNKISSAAYESRNATELLDEAERDILAIRPNQKSTSDIKSLVHQAIDKIEVRCQSSALSGLSTGLIDLDKISDGLHKGEMIVVAGFPSTGKTALAVNICIHNAIRGIPCAIFSAEMRPVQLVVRSICSEARVNFYKVCYNDVPKMTVAAGSLAKAPLHIEQANGLSIGQVCAAARRLKQKFKIELVVIDYIQLLSGTGDNREQSISSISKGIKAMALELDLPVLALSQLTDDGKLRESRAIGQDADTIWKLENSGEWQASIQPIKLNIDKCRDGATGKIELQFFKEFTRFENTSKV